MSPGAFVFRFFKLFVLQTKWSLFLLALNSFIVTLNKVALIRLLDTMSAPLFFSVLKHIGFDQDNNNNFILMQPRIYFVQFVLE